MAHFMFVIEQIGIYFMNNTFYDTINMMPVQLIIGELCMLKYTELVQMDRIFISVKFRELYQLMAISPVSIWLALNIIKDNTFYFAKTGLLTL